MSSWRTLGPGVVPALAAICLLAAEEGGAADEILTNELVIKLVKAGFSEGVISEKIQAKTVDHARSEMFVPQQKGDQWKSGQMLIAQETQRQHLCGSAEGKFKRVTELPQGEQINALVSGLLSGFDLSNSVETVCAAPELRVWAAAKRAAERVHSVGKRPLVASDERMRRTKNGVIRQDATVGAGAGAWLDEIVIEVARLATDDSTKVVVWRRVVKAIPGRRERQWRTAKSNGEVERWVLTQIEDELVAPTAQPTTETAGRIGRPPVGLSDDAENQLRKLRDLRDKGLVGEEEYQAMRRRLLEGLVAPPAPSSGRGVSSAPSNLSGTYAGVITGDAGGQRVEVRVTFTVIQSGNEVAGTWASTSGMSGTISGVLSGSTIAPLRAIQINPCRGEFIGVATIEENFARLRVAYTGQDCQGPVSATFTADRQ